MREIECEDKYLCKNVKFVDEGNSKSKLNKIRKCAYFVEIENYVK